MTDHGLRLIANAIKFLGKCLIVAVMVFKGLSWSIIESKKLLEEG